MINGMSHISDNEKRQYFLANSRCACCGKALKDPVSERYGIGPSCRKIHGFEDAQKEADWTALAPLEAVALRYSEVADFVGVDFVAALNKRKANDVVKVLLRWLSAFADTADADEVFQAVRAIRSCGWEKLSDKVSERISAVKIGYGTNEFNGHKYETVEIETPYSPVFISEMRSIKAFFKRDGRRKYYVVTAKKKAEVWEAIKRCFPGTYGYAAGKGMFKIN